MGFVLGASRGGTNDNGIAQYRVDLGGVVGRAVVEQGVTVATIFA
ncbi:hypothetical protein ACFL5O_11975 [Myxococcota bacterium]